MGNDFEMGRKRPGKVEIRWKAYGDERRRMKVSRIDAGRLRGHSKTMTVDVKKGTVVAKRNPLGSRCSAWLSRYCSLACPSLEPGSEPGSRSIVSMLIWGGGNKDCCCCWSPLLDRWMYVVWERRERMLRG